MAVPLNENVRESPVTPNRKASLDFTSHHVSEVQPPLRLTDTTISDFSLKLKNYLSVLVSGQSIALHRGERLASIRLEKGLQSLFSTAAPRVVDGPPMTWVTLVLAVGPQFDGSSVVKIGESHVELAADDLELIRSGRPWRFLSPWPDHEDCKKELQSIETTQRELVDTKESIKKVLEDILLLEGHLKDRRQLVAHMYQGDYSARQMRDVTWNSNRNPGSSHSNNVPADELGNSMHIDVLSSLSGLGPNFPEGPAPRRDTESGDTTIRAGADEPSCIHNGSLLANESPINKTHPSDFIQVLRDALGDSRNHEAMRWSEDGQSFQLAPEHDFPPQLLTRLSTASYASLVRRLYYFGFHKIGGAYRHESFIRGQLNTIRPPRRGNASSSHSSNGSPRQGPRFKVIKRSLRRS